MDTSILSLPQQPSGSPASASTHEHTDAWSRFKLLLWKNWTIQKRHKIQTVIEVLLPVLFASLLVIIRDLAPADVVQNATIYPAYRLGQNLPDIPAGSFANLPFPGGQVLVSFDFLGKY